MPTKPNFDFEHSFRRALNAAKAGVQEGTDERKMPFTHQDRTLVATISVGYPGEKPYIYDFWQRAGMSEDVLDSPITVYGPAFQRGMLRDGQKHFLAIIKKMAKSGTKYTNLATGSSENAKRTRRNLDDAIEKFWKKMGHSPIEATGWRLTPYDDKGWAYLNRRRPNGNYKEVAIIAAVAPGQHLQFYTPDGKRKMTYEEERKLNVPQKTLPELRERFTKAGVWEALVQAWTSLKDRPLGSYVSAWESKGDWGRRPR